MSSALFNSVVVCTAGPATYLRQCLETLKKNLELSICEVIVVDNNQEAHFSSNVRDILKDLPFQLITESSPGLSAARHAGALASRSQIISFIDDDVLISSTWHKALLASFSSDSTVLAGGPSFPAFQGVPSKWIEKTYSKTASVGEACAWLSLLDLKGDVDSVDPNLVWGLNFNVRKNRLFQLGGFNPDLMPSSCQQFQGNGETGLTERIKMMGLNAKYAQDLSVSHIVPLSRLQPSYIRKRAFYQGVGDSYTVLRGKIARESKFKSSGSRLVSVLRSLRRFDINYIIFTFIWEVYVSKGSRWLLKLYNQDVQIRDWVELDNYIGVHIPCYKIEKGI